MLNIEMYLYIFADWKVFTNMLIGVENHAMMAAKKVYTSRKRYCHLAENLGTMFKNGHG